MKRISILLIIAICSLFVFSGCKKDAEELSVNSEINVNEKNAEEAAAENEVIDYEDGLSTERYDGYNFRMFLRKDMTKEQYFEEDSADIVESALYKRNKAVEEKYGITITASEATSPYGADALNSILAGDDSYDVIFAHSRTAFIYAVQGGVYNVNDISSIHLDKPWWSKNIKDNCTVNGYLYVLDGDISKQSLSCAMAMYFNKRIFDELGFDYPYQSVKDGEWTFDMFSYLAKKGGAYLNGNGVMELEKDRYGFVTLEWEGPINILYSSGEKIYDMSENGALELTLYSNKTVEIFDSFFNLMDNEACALIYQQGDNKYTGTHPFMDGRAMITTGGLGAAAGYRNMDDDFGIIPYPKYDEDDEYTTAINGSASLAVVPITVSDVERTGAIIEALAAYSSKEVIPAFYEKSLKSKYARDEESEEMMDIIKDSIIYDIGYVSGGAFQSIGRDLAISTNHDFASAYASKESAAINDLKEFNRDYGHIE